MRLLRPSALLAPTSWPATAFHRGVIAVQGKRLSASADPRAQAVARALRASAARTADTGERRALIEVETRRAELPFEFAAAGLEMGLVPGEPTVVNMAPEASTSPEERLAIAWEVCRWTCISPIWGEFLFRLIRELRPTRCVELGTGLGLSGAYQASALRLNDHGSITTVDVSHAAKVAASGFDALELRPWIRNEFADLDHDLDRIAGAAAPVEYAFLDAEHSEAATVRHFEGLLPHLADDAVLVFDDITQTDEMRRAWGTVVNHPEVRRAVPLRRFGVAIVGQR